jgi:uncharacterized protein
MAKRDKPAIPANENRRDAGMSIACPICGKSADGAVRPFCSKRCADVDLQRWLSGRYAVPVVEEDRSVSEGPDDGGSEG